ncbi:MAG: glycosyltransferase [Candidatus Eremiobacteraeota bacterium]|nr:glycosyltransferase [Candidatus Eremiobacteraeota bacterium]
MDVMVSVVVPVYNGAATIEACLQALRGQSLSEPYEVIVVDDGSTDATPELVQRVAGVRWIRQRNAGAPAARNRGVAEARGEWIAFTDADCIPSRTWLARLVAAARKTPDAIGAAGRTTGHNSVTPAARFVDLMGGLDPEQSLAHPTFPWAPSANLMYRRAYLDAAGGYDTRYATFDACDLHTRLRSMFAGEFYYEPSALVLHRHRASWKAYWRQQFSYGIGYAQFMLRHRGVAQWRVGAELREIGTIVRAGLRALLPAKDDEGVVRRGLLLRHAAQHAGFIRTYYNPRERARW